MDNTNKKNNVVLESFIFPTRHLPPCFTNELLFNKLPEIYDEYLDLNEILNENFVFNGKKITDFKGYNDNIYGLKKGVEPLNFNISKPNGANRIMTVANPLVLIPLHFYIIDNNIEILAEQSNENEKFLSSSKYFFEQGFIFRNFDDYENFEWETYTNIVQSNYKSTLLNKQKISNGKYYHLSIDISNFFNNIYTHTISWNLVNDRNKHIFDNMDILNRTLNCNETKGLVIGPYTSSLFSEIILSKIDNLILPFCEEKDVSYTRFCDDFDFYCDSKDILSNETIIFISEQLSRFKLDLNMNKLKLEEFPFVSLNTIQNKSLFLLLKRLEENSYENSLELVEDIINEINNSIKIKYSNCNYLLTILTSLFSSDKVNDILIDSDSAEVLLDYLVNMFFKQNMITKAACNFILCLFNVVDVDKEKMLIKWIKKRNARENYIKEITEVWLSYLIIKLNLQNDIFDTYMLSMLNKSTLGANLSMEYFWCNSLIVKYKSEIKSYLKKIKEELLTRFDSNWKQAGYYTKYWMLFYTNCVRWKIHEEKGFGDTIFYNMVINDLIHNDSTLEKKLNLLNKLYEKNVEFLTFD